MVLRQRSIRSTTRRWCAGFRAGTEYQQRCWAGSNLLHTQVNLTPKNILFSDFLVNIDNQGRVGLAPLDPISTTSNLHTRDFTGSIKDQVYFGPRSAGGFRLRTSSVFAVANAPGRQPVCFLCRGQCRQLLRELDAGRVARSGLDSRLLAQVFAGRLASIGSGARMPTGCITMPTIATRGTKFLLGLAGELLSATTFGPPALFHVSDVEMSSFMLDTWRISKNLQFTLGVREDWDERMPAPLAWSPRLAGSWSPFRSGRTRASGGLRDHPGCGHHEYAGASTRSDGADYDLSGWRAGRSSGSDYVYHRQSTAPTPRDELECGRGSAAIDTSICNGEVFAAARDRRVRVRQSAGAGRPAIAASVTGRRIRRQLRTHESPARRLT